MTFAPQHLKDLAAYWVKQGGVNLGIVGDTAHGTVGVSYHLGRSQLKPTAYSIQLPRDKSGLSEAASAIDLGKLGGSYKNLRTFTRWFVDRCMADMQFRHDVREVIYSPDGVKVQRYSGVDNQIHTGLGNGDASHIGHTHISFWRDSEKRPKVWLFEGYFLPDTASEEDDDVPGLTLTDIALEPGWVIVKPIPGVQAVQVDDPVQRFILPPGTEKPTIGKARVVGDPFGPDTPTESRHIVRLIAGKDRDGAENELAVLLASQVDGPAPVPEVDCAPIAEAAVASAREQDRDAVLAAVKGVFG